MKKVLSLLILACIISSCNKQYEEDNEDKSSSVSSPKDNIKTSENSALQKKLVLSQISEFPVIKDTSQFIANLREIFELEVDESPYQKENERISNYEKIQLYGSENDFIFIEYDYGYGCEAAFPWKYQLLINMDGKPIKSLSAMRFEFIEIFENQAPFLLIVGATSKGNGGHSIFKMSNDTLENVLDDEFPYYLRTYDAHQDNRVNEPLELDIQIRDINNDGFNDISFAGKFVLIQGLTENGDWYDTEIINNKKINYSVDNPFDQIPVEFVFIFDEETKHFKTMEDYSNKYELYE